MLSSVLKTIICTISLAEWLWVYRLHLHPIFFINIPVLITGLMSWLGRGGVENVGSIILKYLQDFTIAQTVKKNLPKIFLIYSDFSFLFMGQDPPLQGFYCRQLFRINVAFLLSPLPLFPFICSFHTHLDSKLNAYLWFMNYFLLIRQAVFTCYKHVQYVSFINQNDDKIFLLWNPLLSHWYKYEDTKHYIHTPSTDVNYSI